jgi:hypothetical protein
VAFSPGSKTFASGGQDRKIRLWHSTAQAALEELDELARRRRRRVVAEPPGEVSAARCDPAVADGAGGACPRARMGCSAMSAWRWSQASPSGPCIGTTRIPRSNRPRIDGDDLAVGSLTAPAKCRVRGGLKAKFGTKQGLVPSELAHRLRLVALGQVHLDEGGTATLPERLCAPGRAGGAGGFPPAAKGDEAPGERFQGMHSQLPPVFSLDQHPIVIPVGQQVSR